MLPPAMPADPTAAEVAASTALGQPGTGAGYTAVDPQDVPAGPVLVARGAVWMTRDTARLLLEEALYLCQHGERAPGSGPWPADTWPEWARRAEEWLRGGPAREPVDVASLVTPEMVRRASGAGYRAVPLTRPILRPPDEFVRAALLVVAADVYGRVRRECAAELTAWLDRQDGIGDYWMGELREILGVWARSEEET